MELLKEKTVKTHIQDWKLSDIINVRVTKNGKKEVVSLNYTGDKLKWTFKNSLSGKPQTQAVYPTLVKPEFFDFCKVGSPWWENVNFRGKKYPWIFKEMVIEKPKLDEIKKENIVFLYGSGHVVFSYDEKILPIPYWGDYTGNGNFDSDHYELEPLVEHLKKHKSILKDNAATGLKTLEIMEVPYYNQNSARNLKHINVLVLPTVEEINKMYQKAIKVRGGEFWSVHLKELVLGPGYSKSENDYLGINKFLKKPNN